MLSSCSVDTNVQLIVRNLEGVQPPASPDYRELLSNVMVKYVPSYEESMSVLTMVFQIYSENCALTLPVYEHCSSLKYFCDGNWVDLPIKYCDIPKDAVITINIYLCDGPFEMKVVGGTSISLFDGNGILRNGVHHLKIIKNKVVSSKLNSDDVHNSREMFELIKSLRKFCKGDMIKVKWLDQLTLSQVHCMRKNVLKYKEDIYFSIEFPEFLYNDQSVFVIYYNDSNDVIQVNPCSDIIKHTDTEILQENLIDRKYHILSRNLRNYKLDKILKPNLKHRNTLQSIIKYPCTRPLTNEEKDLVWKYRYFLCNEKKALIKFLNSISWKINAEVLEAVNLLQFWVPINIEHALQLLTVNFKHPEVRKYAVKSMMKMEDNTLLLYMLQLVQALKYENFDIVDKKFKETVEKKSNILHEHCCSDDLVSFLIYRSCSNFILANSFYWFLVVECENFDSFSIQHENEIRSMYIKVLQMFLHVLQSNMESQNIHKSLQRQLKFVCDLVKVMKTIYRENGNRMKKLYKLQNVLNESDELSTFESLPFPLDPQILINGIIPEKCDLFKSSLMPLKLTFTTSENSEYTGIFKYGDDLRQDQLVLQIITVIDKIFNSENFDLKLTPYRVLSTSIKHGFVQYVHSFPVSQVLGNYGSIQNFLREYNPSTTGPYGISRKAMDTYIRSCAGYCVITYLLGVGDRHLDNLLLRDSGNIFHIDFGYILGRDPKPLPPPMRLSKEMVEAMGGLQSIYYNEFCKLCYTAFIYLRQHADIILSVFSLMIDSNIPDIALEPDKICMKIENKLKLNLSDEEAVCYFKRLLHISITAVFPVIVDQLHKFTQYWTK